MKVPEVAGTINTLLLVGQPVTAPTLARLVMTVTEAKAAALSRLAVPSCYSQDLATGTGTDQFAIAAPNTGERPLTSASAHTKFGELVGVPLPDLPFLRHIGIYAYRAGFLRRFAALAPTPLERIESLEQLRALEHGHAIAVRIAPEAFPAGVDTADDLARVERVLAGSA